MSDVMALVLLRRLVGGVIATLGDHYPHEKLSGACRRLGLPEPPGDEGTERQRAQARATRQGTLTRTLDAPKVVLRPSAATL